METRKLYYEEPYLREFESEVAETRMLDGNWVAALTETAFYPEGGGQGADNGKWILDNGKELEVTDVHERNGIIWHTLSGPVTIGQKVRGIINWERRFDHMQQHSGEHIVSGIICSTFNCSNVGFHMGEDVVTIDYDARISMEDALLIEEKANRYIWENHAFVQMWPDADELKTLEYRSKKELEGPVRITSFPGADMCACCGTHVSSSAEVGLVKLTSAKNFHEGTRLELYCGKRALDFLSMNYAQNKAVAVLLSTKEEKTAGIVEKQIADHIALKGRMAALEDDYFRRWAAGLEKGKEAVIVSDELDADQGRKLADAAANETGAMAAVFTLTSAGSNEYRYAVIHTGTDISGLVKDMNQKLNGRGGGRDGFAQGTLSAPKEEIYKFFNIK